METVRVSDESAVTIGTAAPTGTTLVSTPNRPRVGQPVLFTAKVSGANPTGTVTFHNGSVTLGASLLSGSAATLSTSALGAGSHAITTTYNGDVANAPSTSARRVLLVLRGAQEPDQGDL